MSAFILLKASEYFYKFAGLLSYPKQLYEEINAWAQHYLALQILKRINKKNTPEYIELKNEVKKNLASDKINVVTHKTNHKSFSAEFTLSEHDLNQISKLTKIEEEFESIVFEVILDLNAQETGGFISTEDNNDKFASITFEIPEIKINDIKTYLITKEWLSNAARHELQHAWQFVGDAILNSSNNFGYPSQKLRDDVEQVSIFELRKSNRQETEEEEIKYRLDDSEFYTLLTDSVNAFEIASKNENFELKLEHAKFWVGEDSKYLDLIMKYFGSERESKAGYSYSLFFTTLREHNFGKWKKAVKEFYKAIRL